MNKIITLCCFIIFVNANYSQQASDYFPEDTGFVWDFRSTPLDSLNNKIDSLSFARQDSFAVVDMHQGKNANIVPTKSGPFQTINLQTYDDTLFYHFDGTEGYDYFDLGPLEIVLSQLDSLGISATFNFLDFFKSLEAWYTNYKFGSNVGAEYTLLQKDTLINTSFGNFTFRFEYTGTRLQDENLQTTIGTLDCKKFLLQWKVKVFLLPPLPPTTIITTENSIWIAPDYWIVQDVIPTNNVDLSFFGVDPFFIPGIVTEIEGITNIEYEFVAPETFYLSQNYPNPFNPNTTIKFQIAEHGLVSLKIYDVLGNEIVTLINEEKPAGNYELNWNADKFSSGVYYYKVSVGDIVETKKMLLLK
ncbi:MAG: T9SS type A sorting domain-containing protein [Ignavibacteria bacterium]|nr:T9SS type A sorting domain-containing protein [Ignavibacteria bacterium]MBT8383283.1 T9SS type A sorting domain-containing protein [Ignavibacteria bacterium]MBT8390903.1 T9SS type A sorting domain-containing protein [Ignavibacteria bacterium]NNJ54262.1 T9SS type A sorting domain-containing protein [Ignavibacteriaceae bacterium]NNL20569.1 T9SS type A sorting domain-containing protein [Ignavibacteriaceae bacterium]